MGRLFVASAVLCIVCGLAGRADAGKWRVTRAKDVVLQKMKARGFDPKTVTLSAAKTKKFGRSTAFTINAKAKLPKGTPRVHRLLDWLKSTSNVQFDVMVAGKEVAITQSRAHNLLGKLIQQPQLRKVFDDLVRSNTAKKAAVGTILYALMRGGYSVGTGDLSFLGYDTALIAPALLAAKGAFFNRPAARKDALWATRIWAKGKKVSDIQLWKQFNKAFKIEKLRNKEGRYANTNPGNIYSFMKAFNDLPNQ